MGDIEECNKIPTTLYSVSWSEFYLVEQISYYHITCFSLFLLGVLYLKIYDPITFGFINRN